MKITFTVTLTITITITTRLGPDGRRRRDRVPARPRARQRGPPRRVVEKARVDRRAARDGGRDRLRLGGVGVGGGERKLEREGVPGERAMLSWMPRLGSSQCCGYRVSGGSRDTHLRALNMPLTLDHRPRTGDAGSCACLWRWRLSLRGGVVERQRSAARARRNRTTTGGTRARQRETIA